MYTYYYSDLNDLIPYFKYEYEYDANGNFIMQNYSRDWNNESNSWGYSDKLDLTYNKSYFKIDLIMPEMGYYHVNMPILETYSYSNFNDETQEYEWFPGELFTYYWSSKNLDTKPEYTITGKVTHNGAPLSGVKVSYAEYDGGYEKDATYTDESGNYTLTVYEGTKVVLTAFMVGYNFTPASIDCGTVSANLSNKNFTALEPGDVFVAEVNPKSALTVSPNPTKGELRIANYELRDGGVELFDVMGKRQKVESNIQTEEATLNISHLPAGIYLLRIADKMVKVVKE